MNPLFADTFYFLALLNSNDAAHERTVRDARQKTIEAPSFGTVKTVPFRSYKGAS